MTHTLANALTKLGGRCINLGASLGSACFALADRIEGPLPGIPADPEWSMPELTFTEPGLLWEAECFLSTDYRSEAHEVGDKLATRRRQRERIAGQVGGTA